MTPDEQYFFDINGYVVLDDLLSADQLARLHAAIDAQQFPPPGESIDSQRFGGFLAWDEPLFRDLMNHPRILTVLRRILGDGLRLDHEYGIFMAPGTKGLHLHGGGTPYDPAQYYVHQNGNVYCGLVVISWALSDVGPGDGGFCCIPGSHKANFPLAAAVRHYEAHTDWVHQVPQKAGSAVLFTEALTHGTLPWRAKHERRSLLYKYSPGHLTWGSAKRSPELLALMNDEQRRLLEPPYVYRRANVVAG